MKILISEGSRKLAHNLDDLQERWTIRRAQSARYEVDIPYRIPKFKTLSEAVQYRADLQFFYDRLFGEKLGAEASERKDLNMAIAETKRLLGQVKSQIITLETARQAQAKTLFDAEFSGQLRTLKRMLIKKAVLVHENEHEIVLVFPSIKQTVIIQKEERHEQEKEIS